MRNPDVSIITVCFNAADTIEATMVSVSEQAGVALEHIIVDGNSSDGTQAKVKRLAGEQTQFVSEPDEGLYAAMNKGAAMANAPVIAFLNADDVYAHDGVVALALQTIQKERVEAVYADLVFIDESDQVKRVWDSQPYRKGLCFNGWMPAHPTLFMRRAAFTALGGFDLSLKYQADLEFCARAFEVANITSRYVPEIWVRMRLGGISTGRWGPRIAGNWESYLALKRLGLKRGPVSFFMIKFSSKLLQFFPRLHARKLL